MPEPRRIRETDYRVERDDGVKFLTFMSAVRGHCGKNDKSEHAKLLRACDNDAYWQGHMWERL